MSDCEKPWSSKRRWSIPIRLFLIIHMLIVTLIIVTIVISVINIDIITDTLGTVVDKLTAPLKKLITDAANPVP